MSFFGIFGNRKSAEFQLWEDGISIYQYISDNIDAQSGRLKEAASKLPDEERRFKPGDLRWVAGGLDGSYRYHGGGQDAERADRIARMITKLAKSGSKRLKQKIYRILINDDLIGYIDPFVAKVVHLGILPSPYLHDFARTLTIRSPDRGPVKFGIVILGLIQDRSDLPIVKLFGKHDEFTLYSAVAITRIAKNPEAELFELAKMVDGWGKIYLVERLAQTKDPAIKSWLVREGYKNKIMHEYLAYACAVSGDIHQELAKQSIDEELFDGAGDIIDALLLGGPAEDIGDYDHAAELIDAYLRHFNSFPKKLTHFLVLQSIRSYLSNEKWNPAEIVKNGWSDELKERALDIIQQLIAQPEWSELVHLGLSSEDQLVFFNADRAAKYLDIDTWDVQWTRLLADPINPMNWYSIMTITNEERIDAIVDFAVRSLPLKEIAIGPAEERGLGLAYEAHSCLDVVLQDLGKFPGKGETLIIAGLASPVIRNRVMALKALSAFPIDKRSIELKRALGNALTIEPSGKVRDMIQKVLQGERIG